MSLKEGKARMKITVLVENTSTGTLPSEHGLSLFVEGKDCRFLFDMGQTDLFARNASTLGLDLNTADFAVLSHGHYDHGGGIGAFLEKNHHARIYMSRHAFEPHYNGTEKYIGLDPRLQASDRIKYVDEQEEIRPGFTLLNPLHAKKFRNSESCGLNMMEDGEIKSDDFRHEQYLLVEENGKRILFSGCSHRGILNIMHWFHPDVLIGGLHLSKFPLDESLASCAAALNAFPGTYYTCHCTGIDQYHFLKERMERLNYIHTGDTILI